MKDNVYLLHSHLSYDGREALVLSQTQSEQQRRQQDFCSPTLCRASKLPWALLPGGRVSPQEGLLLELSWFRPRIICCMSHQVGEHKQCDHPHTTQRTVGGVLTWPPFLKVHQGWYYSPSHLCVPKQNKPLTSSKLAFIGIGDCLVYRCVFIFLHLRQQVYFNLKFSVWHFGLLFLKFYFSDLNQLCIILES